MQLQLSKHPGVTLEDVKAKLKHDIDQAAGRARSRHITVVPGQSETYQAKATNARAYKQAGSPADASTFPWIAAEAIAQGLTADQAADLVLYLENQWQHLGASIEQHRIGGKNLVTSSTSTQEAIAAAKAAIDFLNSL